MRDDSGKSIPPKIPKEEGTDTPEGKSRVPMIWNIILLPQLVNWRCCSSKGFFWPLSVFSVEIMASWLWYVQLVPPKDCLPLLVP